MAVIFVEATLLFRHPQYWFNSRNRVLLIQGVAGAEVGAIKMEAITCAVVIKNKNNKSRQFRVGGVTVTKVRCRPT